MATALSGTARPTVRGDGGARRAGCTSDSRASWPTTWGRPRWSAVPSSPLAPSCTRTAAQCGHVTRRDSAAAIYNSRRGACAPCCPTRLGRLPPHAGARRALGGASRDDRERRADVAIVMAGGSGTRLWPLSRRRSPKQLLALTGETSLLQQTVARLGTLLKPHDIYVITSQAHVRATQEQLPHLPPDNVLGEPLARSTAVAAGLATVIARRESDEVALVLPADHFVTDEGRFAEALEEAARTAERGYLVCLGVVATTPAPARLREGGELSRWPRRQPGGALRREPSAAEAKAMLPTAGNLWKAGSLRGGCTRTDRRWSASSRSSHSPGQIAALIGPLVDLRLRDILERCPPSRSTSGSRSQRPPTVGWPSSRSTPAGATSARGRRSSRPFQRAAARAWWHRDSTSTAGPSGYWCTEGIGWW